MSSVSVDHLSLPTPSVEASSPFFSQPPTPGTSRSLQEFAALQETRKNLKRRGSHKPDADLRPDIEECKLALQLFLESRMIESEQLLRESDPKLERLYIATGYGLIQCVKALMSYEDNDIAAAIEVTRSSSNMASKYRKSVSLASRVTGLVIGSSPVATYKAMTPLQRHAELVYAECLAQKAVLGIIYSGDWLQFIKEAINMRTCVNLFRAMNAFVEGVDADAVERGEGPEDLALADKDFRSGVYLGMGVMHLTLSLLPGRVMPILELFGYKGERKTALELLAKSGRWEKGAASPGVSQEEEGLRRSLCDMVLLLFHLVFPGFTYEGIDIDFAEEILSWNAQRYPSGVFFLFGQGRLALFRANPALAIQYYTSGMEVVQEQFKSLQGVSVWELACAHLAMWNVPSSVENWRRLKAEAGWSKTVYTYGLAACLYQQGGESEREEAAQLMEGVTGLMKRIAGKSIPMEKFCSRKSRKFQSQGKRLLLPALEFAYVLLVLARTPRSVIVESMLPLVNNALGVLRLHEEHPERYCSDNSKEEDARSQKSSVTINEKTKDPVELNGYWDDYCLAHFLHGICLRYVAYPDPYSSETGESPLPDAAKLAKESFEFVLSNGPKIVYDHHIVYWAHYELGRLEARNGNKEEAKRHIELVLSGKVLEVNWSGRKGKYSLENALNLRSNAALEALETGRLL
ncbi:hypothetical protein FRC17_003991 [Serendipita sp. 399]|nr:hypothetical protein FRC17_003991 [Serendipita sp. 399]